MAVLARKQERIAGEFEQYKDSVNIEMEDFIGYVGELKN